MKYNIPNPQIADMVEKVLALGFNPESRGLYILPHDQPGADTQIDHIHFTDALYVCRCPYIYVHIVVGNDEDSTEIIARALRIMQASEGKLMDYIIVRDDTACSFMGTLEAALCQKS